MSTLTGTYISQSYGSVIHLSTNTGIVVGNNTQLEDGLGNALGLYVNTNGTVTATTFVGSLTGNVTGNVSGNAGTVTNGVYTNATNTFTNINTFSASIQNRIVPLSVASNTASMDLSLGNLFSLTLVSGSNIFLNPTNIKLGQTSMLQITQATGGGGSLTWGSKVTFPSATPYTASIGSAVVDTISMVSFNGTNLRAVQAYNFV
jgi:hypothetical protein